jgi:hypothetical protein
VWRQSLADLKINYGAGFRDYVRMTGTDSEVLLQIIACSTSGFNIFSVVHILSTCLGGGSG